MLGRKGFAFVLVGLLLSAGCNIVDKKYLDALRRTDAGPGMTEDAGQVTQEDAGIEVPDAGSSGLGDTCTGSDVPLLSTSVQETFMVDTSTLHSDTMVACTGRGSVGNDGFLAFDATNGQTWHFHLEAIQVPGNPRRDPVVYVGPEGDCAPRSCASALYGDSCANEYGEHFAFTVPTDGRWFVGVDDNTEGGGRYMLTVVRLNCGDGRRSHGEGCEDGNAVDDDACDNKCRNTIGTDVNGETRSSEMEPNDTLPEANRLLIEPGTPVTISGDIGGSDCYPDYIAVQLNGDSATRYDLHVTDANPACATLAPYSLTLLNASGTEAGGGRDGRNCAEINAMNLRTGTFLVRVRPPPGTGAETFSRYQFTFELTRH